MAAFLETNLRFPRVNPPESAREQRVNTWQKVPEAAAPSVLPPVLPATYRPRSNIGNISRKSPANIIPIATAEKRYAKALQMKIDRETNEQRRSVKVARDNRATR